MDLSEGLALPRRRAGLRRAPLDGFRTLLYAAFGFRQLFSAYGGPCVRVRRSSDNAQIDIGFSAGWLDAAALLAFAGAGSAYAVTLYDQTGNGHHATQATAAAQARLVNAGLRDAGPNGRSVAVFDGSDDSYGVQNSAAYSRNRAALTMAAVLARAGSNGGSTNQNLIYGQINNAGGFTRVGLAFSASMSYAVQVGGRRPDGVPIQAVNGASPAINQWVRLVGRLRASDARADISVDGSMVSSPWQTAGSFDDSDQASAVFIGSTHAPNDHADIRLSSVVLAQSALDLAALDVALAQVMP